MPQPTLHIFRHGLATLNPAGYGDTILSASVLPEGYPAVVQVAQHLKTQPCDIAFRSEVRRCQQTAAKVTEITGRGFVPDHRLNEYYMESFDDFTERVQGFWKWLSAQNYQTVWICTHGAVIACLKNTIVQGFFDEENLMNFPPTGMVWTISGKTVTAQDFNNGGPTG